MILPGHIALAVFGHKLLRVELPTALVATLAPDLVDKALAQALHITPSGRYLMHSLVGWLAASLVAYLLGGKAKGRAWAVGHFLHFVGDGGEMPWLLFLHDYSFSEVRELNSVFWEVFHTVQGRLSLALEVLLFGIAAFWMRRDIARERARLTGKGAH